MDIERTRGGGARELGDSHSPKRFELYFSNNNSSLNTRQDLGKSKLPPIAQPGGQSRKLVNWPPLRSHQA